jgi:hypothetical protein
LGQAPGNRPLRQRSCAAMTGFNAVSIPIPSIAQSANQVNQPLSRAKCRTAAEDRAY